MNTLGIIGCGKMGQALIAAIAGAIDTPMLCCDKSESALGAVRQILNARAEYTTDIDTVAARCDTVLVAVKPAQASEVLMKLNNAHVKCILSIVAGLKHDALKGFVPNCEVVRIMPNTPALVGAGSIVILDAGLREETKHLLEMMFSKAGTCHFVARESMMDAVTGLSGSGPALFAMMAEAIADAAVSEGLPRDVAASLARETMLGTARLLEVQHPAILKENVMSPGGTTAAGVLAAEKEGFRSAAAAFVTAATQKSRSM